MKSFKYALGFLIVGALMAGMSVDAQAGDPRLVKHGEAGSVLVFPFFASKGAQGTAMVVTNTNTDTSYVPGSDSRAGDVLVHYLYIDGDDWQVSDRSELLTAGDTLAVLVDQHNPERGGEGFVVVIAKDPETEEPIKFNWLIGSAYVAHGDLNLLWQFTAYSFCSNLDDGAPQSDAGHRFTQEGAGAVVDGFLTFDGTEYGKFPQTLFVDSFIEESDTVDNMIAFMSTAGEYYRNDLDVLIFNNNEQQFSRSFRFTCFANTSLGDISSIAGNLGGDPDEFARETGWARFDLGRVVDGAGNPKTLGDFGILGVFSQAVTGTDFAAGHALHYQGTTANAATLPLK